jgi:hypothetical protein
MKTLMGDVSPGPPVAEALLDAFPGVETKRWFVDDPLYDATDQRTYVLFNNWGMNTEAALASLVARFRDQKVNFRRADGSGAVCFGSATKGDAP